MEQSIVELITRQRQRVDSLATLAGRFLDDGSRTSLLRLAARLTRLAATLATPAARLGAARRGLESQLERLVREVSLLRIDDPSQIARVAWVLAEMEEAFRNTTSSAVMMPVYVAN